MVGNLRDDCPSTAVHLALTVPPYLSLIYAVVVQCFLSFCRECSWTAHAGHILVRAGLVGAAAAVSSAFRPGGGGGDDVVARSAAACAIFAALSAWLIARTRADIIRGPRPRLPERSMGGRVVLVTGANSGIGRETARQLFAAGATVVMGCRSEDRAREAMRDIIAPRDPPPPPRGGATGEAASAGGGNGESSNGSGVGGRDPRDRLLFLKLDVSDLSSVRSAARAFREMNLPLHVLINNAGVMMRERGVSPDGFELTMACNHLGHFLLTNLLLPLLRKHEDARVVTVTSSTYALSTGGIDLDDLNCERRPYSLFGQYSQSKLANIMFGRELARRENARVAALKSRPSSAAASAVASHIVHPGIVRTDVVRNMPWYLFYPNIIFGWAVSTLQKTPSAGANTSVWCAASDDLIGRSGQYYVNSAAKPLLAHAMNDEDAKKLWELSEKLVGLA